jgi:actin-related protein 10
MLTEAPQVPSLSFASAPLLALLASGSITGLVLDVGHIESSAVPVRIHMYFFSHVLKTDSAVCPTDLL